MQKTCGWCEVEKVLEEFGVDRGRNDGLNPYCKECRKERLQERAKKYAPPADLTLSRVCSICRVSKPLSDYPTARCIASGVRPNCKKCERQRKRKQYLAKRLDKASVQPDRCEICGLRLCGVQDGQKTKASPHWDHNHETEVFRGWLCGNCNGALGLLGDNPALLIRASEYLKARGYSVAKSFIG